MDTAYDELVAAGKAVTMSSIRSQMGSGSFRDIHFHYQSLLNAKRGPVPEICDERIRQGLSILELSVADRTRDIQAAWDAERIRYESDLAAMVDANAKLEEGRDALEGEKEELRKLLESEKVRTNSAERALKGAQAEMADAHA